jgi:hypothetical protein
VPGEVLLCVYPCAGATSMHLASDHIHPHKDAGGRPARCRVRIHLLDDMRDAPVVICSELPNNPGGSITNFSEVVAAGVIQNNKLPTPLVWIEHRPEESTNGGEETFELVVFSSYEVIERAPYLGETMAWIGDATWKTLDRASVAIRGWGGVVADRGKRIQFASWNFRYCGVKRTLRRADFLNRRGILRAVL